MKKIILVIFVIILVGCRSLAPEIVNSNGQDNLVILDGKDRINQPGVVASSYSWLWWYVPISLISIMWAIQTFLLKSKDCDCKNEKEKTKMVQNNSSSSSSSTIKSMI